MCGSNVIEVARSGGLFSFKSVELVKNNLLMPVKCYFISVQGMTNFEVTESHEHSILFGCG